MGTTGQSEKFSFFINKSTVFRLAIHLKTSQKSTAWLLSALLCEEDHCQCSAEVTTVSYLCMFLTRLSPDFTEDETRAWNLLVVSAHSPALCSFMIFNQRTPKFSPQIKEASNWEHVSAVKECGDFVANIMIPVTSLGPSRHPCVVCFQQSGQKHAQE